MKFHENPSSGNRVVPCGRADRQSDMTKLVVDFYNSANSRKNVEINTLFSKSCEKLRQTAEHCIVTIQQCLGAQAGVFISYSWLHCKLQSIRHIARV